MKNKPLLPKDAMEARIQALQTEWSNIAKALTYYTIKQNELEREMQIRLKEVTSLIWEYRELLGEVLDDDTKS